ncbi:11687_t:CDS:2 [Dentiscutata erythropus]|uniref:11687_t:CDS:1 n=1 Tax=Dentiscutata erythropus TaxID=1348616 RepID=A0A9N8Z0M9_9GLOM|nr:11687_t:CDS:2 [Dentiscutata erythropus]
MALWKLGFTILFLSPLNSESALIHLLQEAKSRILIYDPKLLKTSKNVQNEINSQYTQTLNIFQQPNSLKNEQIVHFAPVLKLNDDPEKTIAIFHSSGSTSFPKLVPISSRFIFNVDAFEKADDIIVSTAPLFHIYGTTVLIRAIVNPGTVYAFPIVSGTVPLVNEILYSLKQSNASVLYTLPASIEQIHKDRPDEINTLLKLRAINYGAILFLSFHNAYGLTEAGTIMLNIHSSPDIPWNAIPESSIKWIERNDIVDGAKELVIKKGSPNLASIKGNMENGDYKIGDLFIEIPKGSGFYILLGRVDDTYVHTTGEKTNPIPIEDTVRRNEFVKHAAVVGHNGPFNCLLIELDFENLKRTPFLEVTKSIFDSIHQANKECPSHSRIFDEMVYILPLEGNKLPRTFKNGIQRKKVEIEFKEEIEMLYDNFINHKVVPNDVSLSNNQWNEDSVKTIILNSLNSAIGDLFPNEDETSFFALGLDSLSATKLRNILQTQFSVIKLPHDVIFEYNTVQSLTHYLTKELSTQDKNVEDGYEAKLQALKNEVNSYIQKYNKIDNFPSVGNVNGINGNMNEKVERIIILPSDLGDSKFGQTEKIYSKLVQEVTQIYHVAWRLDFNSKIEVFERENIGGTVHLLMLAREAYAHHRDVHFNFTSSIGASLESKTNVKEDELSHDISNALLNGYALSKFITEHVCAEWSQKIGFSLDIHRVGQVCGDSITGVWNTREHIPLMIKGAQVMKIMPTSYSSIVDWIPVDVASQSIVDISLNASFDGDNVRVNHILNPKKTTWSEFLKSLQQSGIDFRIVSNKEWLNTLLTTPEYQNVDKNPVAALSGFFDNVMSESSHDSENMIHYSKLRNCQKIDVKLIKLYVNNWKKISFLD